MGWTLNIIYYDDQRPHHLFDLKNVLRHIIIKNLYGKIKRNEERVGQWRIDQDLSKHYFNHYKYANHCTIIFDAILLILEHNFRNTLVFINVLNATCGQCGFPRPHPHMLTSQTSTMLYRVSFYSDNFHLNIYFTTVISMDDHFTKCWSVDLDARHIKWLLSRIPQIFRTRS